MIKLLPLGAGIAFAVSLSAQSTAPVEIHNANGSLYKECYYVKATKPLKELIAEANATGKYKLQPHKGPAEDGADMEEFVRRIHHPKEDGSHYDGALQSEPGHLVNATLENFEGQDGQGSYPQDPNGMIGSNYYVQTINSTFAAWDKTGAPYIAQTDLDVLFGKLGECDCGDPITVYDKMADRWIISEFEGEISNSNSNIDTLLFAVSKTNDPGGAYWIYAFEPYANSFNDYPKYNVWGNGYYMTCNCSNPDMVVAYERDSMLVGSAHAAFIAVPWNYGPYNLSNSCGGNFFCPQMLDCDGTLPPANAPEYLFYYWDSHWGCGTVDSIVIEKITMDWATHSGAIDAKFQQLTMATINSVFPAAFDANIPQPGNNTSDYLASSDGFFGYRIPYLRWVGYNSAVMQFPVNIGTITAPVSAVRWFELRQDTVTNLWSIYQQSTYGPADGDSRWEAAIAEDQNGDIGLEYSVSSPTSTYPGLRYTGRRYCDALNTMTLAEGTVVSGNALVSTPEDGGNRWGDYSHLSVDPTDGITFWGTNMYAESGAGFGINAGTRVFSFQVPTCPTGVTEVNNSTNASVYAYQNGSTLTIKGTGFPQGERLVVQLFDETGKMLMQNETVTNTQTLENSFNVSSLAKAIYLIRVGNDHLQRVIRVVIH